MVSLYLSTIANYVATTTSSKSSDAPFNNQLRRLGLIQCKAKLPVSTLNSFTEFNDILQQQASSITNRQSQNNKNQTSTLVSNPSEPKIIVLPEIQGAGEGENNETSPNEDQQQYVSGSDDDVDHADEGQPAADSDDYTASNESEEEQQVMATKTNNRLATSYFPTANSGPGNHSMTSKRSRSIWKHLWPLQQHRYRRQAPAFIGPNGINSQDPLTALLQNVLGNGQARNRTLMLSPEQQVQFQNLWQQVLFSTTLLVQQMMNSMLRTATNNIPIHVSNLAQMMANIIRALTINNPLIINSPIISSTTTTVAPALLLDENSEKLLFALQAPGTPAPRRPINSNLIERLAILEETLRSLRRLMVNNSNSSGLQASATETLPSINAMNKMTSNVEDKEAKFVDRLNNMTVGVVNRAGLFISHRERRRSKRSIGSMLMYGPFSKFYMAMMINKLIRQQSGVLSQAVMGELVRRYVIPTFLGAASSTGAPTTTAITSALNQMKNALTGASLASAGSSVTETMINKANQSSSDLSLAGRNLSLNSTRQAMFDADCQLVDNQLAIEPAPGNLLPMRSPLGLLSQAIMNNPPLKLDPNGLSISLPNSQTQLLVPSLIPGQNSMHNLLLRMLTNQPGQANVLEAMPGFDPNSMLASEVPFQSFPFANKHMNLKQHSSNDDLSKFNSSSLVNGESSDLVKQLSKLSERQLMQLLASKLMAESQKPKSQAADLMHDSQSTESLADKILFKTFEQISKQSQNSSMEPKNLAKDTSDLLSNSFAQLIKGLDFETTKASFREATEPKENNVKLDEMEYQSPRSKLIPSSQIILDTESALALVDRLVALTSAKNQKQPWADHSAIPESEREGVLARPEQMAEYQDSGPIEQQAELMPLSYQQPSLKQRTMPDSAMRKSVAFVEPKRIVSERAQLNHHPVVGFKQQLSRPKVIYGEEEAETSLPLNGSPDYYHVSPGQFPEQQVRLNLTKSDLRIQTGDNQLAAKDKLTKLKSDSTFSSPGGEALRLRKIINNSNSLGKSPQNLSSILRTDRKKQVELATTKGQLRREEEEEGVEANANKTSSSVASANKQGEQNRNGLNNLAMALNMMNMVLLNQKLATTNSSKPKGQSGSLRKTNVNGMVTARKQTARLQATRQRDQGSAASGPAKLGASTAAPAADKTVTALPHVEPAGATERAQIANTTREPEAGNKNHRSSANGIKLNSTLLLSTPSEQRQLASLGYSFEPLKLAGDGARALIKNSTIRAPAAEQPDDPEREHATRWNDVLRHIVVRRRRR